jgi:hypothetical protein
VGARHTRCSDGALPPSNKYEARWIKNGKRFHNGVGWAGSEDPNPKISAEASGSESMCKKRRSSGRVDREANEAREEKCKKSSGH